MSDSRATEARLTLVGYRSMARKKSAPAPTPVIQEPAPAPVIQEPAPAPVTQDIPVAPAYPPLEDLAEFVAPTENLLGTPEPPEETRETLGHIPETLGHVPETLGHVPETLGHIPEAYAFLRKVILNDSPYIPSRLEAAEVYLKSTGDLDEELQEAVFKVMGSEPADLHDRVRAARLLLGVL